MYHFIVFRKRASIVWKEKYFPDRLLFMWFEEFYSWKRYPECRDDEIEAVAEWLTDQNHPLARKLQNWLIQEAL